MGQTAFEIQAETCMSYLIPFPQGIRYFCELLHCIFRPDETLALVFDILLEVGGIIVLAPFRSDCHETMLICFGYVYTMPDSLCADTKTISDRASVHRRIANFGAVFTTERRCCE